MRTLVNDEIEIPAEMTKDRRPTERLRLREIDGERMLLEQLWQSPLVGVEDAWVPVPSIANAGAVPRRGSDVGTSPLLGISSGAE